PTISSLYAQLSFIGEKVTFVSEKQLAEGRAKPLKVIVLPQATHVSDATVAALARFVAVGGTVLAVGEKNLSFDEYHRSRDLPSELLSAPKLIPQTDEQASARQLHDLLEKAGLKLTELQDAAGKPAWGIEYRVATSGKRSLIPMINFMKDAR